MFSALHCLSPSYHFFLPAPMVKQEAAARSLLGVSFWRTLAEGPPPVWQPTTLTFKAHSQPHMLTQAFASKGNSQHTHLSFEDLSSFASYFPLPHLALGFLHPEDGEAALMRKHQSAVLTSDLFPYNRF